MRYSLIVMLALITGSLFGQHCEKLYSDLLEPGSKLMSCEYTYTIEKLSTGLFVFKRYYPDTRTITQFATFKTKKLNIKHGYYRDGWDDGTVVNTGTYVDDQKQGEWVENEFSRGQYIDNRREGTWLTIRKDSLVRIEENYLHGELHGVQLHYDSLGHIEYREEYAHGALLTTTRDTSQVVEEELPRYPGCENEDLNESSLNECASRKLLEYVYGNIRYPANARRLGIQGRALARFVIEKDGTITDIKVLNGLCDEITNEIRQLIENMPRWRPGTQNGVPVRVLFTLPVSFKLQ